MDDFYEFAQAGREKHQHMLQTASDRRRQKRIELDDARQSVPTTLRLHPVLTTLINWVAQ